MFEQPRYIQNSFSIFFPRQLTIRRKANEFEDRLAGQYFQPQIIPIPDDFSPEAPRLIFGSEHGFSQIIISQINISINVTYSPDWQLDINRAKSYLSEKVPVLFDLVDILEEPEVRFCGLITKTRLVSKEDDNLILAHIAKVFFAGADEPDLHDLQIKKTVIHSGQFFSNQTVSNYRVWSIPENTASVPHLSNNQIVERGIEITGDFNDRYKYNQNQNYTSDRSVANEIINQSINEINRLIGLVKEELL